LDEYSSKYSGRVRRRATLPRPIGRARFVSGVAGDPLLLVGDDFSKTGVDVAAW